TPPAAVLPPVAETHPGGGSTSGYAPYGCGSTSGCASYCSGPYCSGSTSGCAPHCCGPTSGGSCLPCGTAPECEAGPCCEDSCCEGVCGPPGRVWVRGEYLLWWTKSSPLPPLVTTSPIGTPVGEAGVLGQFGTSILFGGESVSDNPRSGGRV